MCSFVANSDYTNVYKAENTTVLQSFRPLQISRNFSTTTANESGTQESSNTTAAMYKGLKVAVYMADKTEITLTRQHLIELVNVRVVFICNQSNSRSIIFMSGNQVPKTHTVKTKQAQWYYIGRLLEFFHKTQQSRLVRPIYCYVQFVGRGVSRVNDIL